MTVSAYRTPFPMAVIEEPRFPSRCIDSSDFSSIQEAVNYCSDAGGGTVIVPDGIWHSGPIHLRSNICLHLCDNAAIHFSHHPDDYLPVVFTRWEGIECLNYSPLIYAKDCCNIAITGNGTLFGNGQEWWSWKNRQQAAANELYASCADGLPVEKRIYGTKIAALRPSFVQFMNCHTVLVEGITLLDGPQWTLHPVYCENVVIRRVHVRTAGPNTDGLNPDSCRNVLIEDSDFCTGDDCIAINSGLNEDGWRVKRPCENILIRNCSMTGGHGAVVIGSAISGDVRHVYAHNCSIHSTMQGLRLKSMRGRGGTVEDITFEDIKIHDVSNEAIQVNMFYEYSTVMPRSKKPSLFRDIHFRRIYGTGSQTGIMLKGLPEQKLDHITLEEVQLHSKNAAIISDTKDLKLNNISIQT